MFLITIKNFAIMNVYNLESNVPDASLINYFSETEGIEEISLYSITIQRKAYGQYIIVAQCNVNNARIINGRNVSNETINVRASTTNTQLIDAWNSSIHAWEEGEDGFDTWEEVVDCMLSTLNLSSEVIRLMDELDTEEE